MKRALLALLFVCLATSHVAADNDDFKIAIALFNKHHYHDAALMLRNYMPNATPQLQARTRLGFGMVCLANARTYAQLYDMTLAVQSAYFQRLVQSGKDRPKSASLLAVLYLGKAEMMANRLPEAAGLLEQFLQTTGTNAADRHEAAVALGTAYHAMGKLKRADEIWSEVPTDIPQSALLLAAAYLEADIRHDEATALWKDATTRLKEAKAPLPVQAVSALLSIYGRQDMQDKGFDLIAAADLGAYAHEEVIGPNKVLRFYDPALLRNLAFFYNRSAITALRKAGTSDKVRISAMARLFAGEAYAFSKRMDEALQVVNDLIAAQPPKAIYRRAQIRRTAFSQRSASPETTSKAFDDIVTEQIDAAELADILTLCAELKIRCPAAIERATTLWGQSQGRPPVRLSMAMGQYYRSRQNPSKALGYLEAARDKSRKNRIETNPPVLLVDLAWAYYAERQFSEALEIYFTMSKQFHAVRQIQVSLQGIYSMEQQSAGDAKIF